MMEQGHLRFWNKVNGSCWERQGWQIIYSSKGYQLPWVVATPEGKLLENTQRRTLRYKHADMAAREVNRWIAAKERA